MGRLSQCSADARNGYRLGSQTDALPPLLERVAPQLRQTAAETAAAGATCLACGLRQSPFVRRFRRWPASCPHDLGHNPHCYCDPMGRDSRLIRCLHRVPERRRFPGRDSGSPTAARLMPSVGRAAQLPHLRVAAVGRMNVRAATARSLAYQSFWNARVAAHAQRRLRTSPLAALAAPLR